MIAWTQTRYGGPEVVHPADAVAPEPGPGEVLIDVRACSLNSADIRVMRGLPYLVRLGFGLRRPKTPVPGRDVAGVVVAVGSGVRFAVGDRVAGELPGAGGLAEQVVAPAEQVVAIPSGVSDRTAAALPMAGGTAWQALDAAGVADGSRVLILGAGGGIGTLAVRLAVLRGADVHALCSAWALDAVGALGAVSVRDRALGLSALDAASFDAVIDLGGRAPLGQLQRLVREGGASVSVAVGENRVGPIGRLLGLSLRSIGSRRPMRALFATPRPELTTQLLDLAATGALVPVIDSVFALDDADAALGRMDAGGVVGKVLVSRA